MNTDGIKFSNIIYLSLAIVVTLATLFLCRFSMKTGTAYIKTKGSPTLTVNSFFDALTSGQYEKAYSMMDSCDTLGLEATGTDIESAVLMEALKNSYGYSLNGSAVFDGRSAVQSVNFTYLDLDAIEADTSAVMERILNEKSETLKRKELYDKDGYYLPEVLEESYSEALKESIGKASMFYKTITFDVTASFDGEKWLVEYNDDLMKGLLGGRE